MEIQTHFYKFVKEVQNKQNLCSIEAEKEKIMNFLSSLTLDCQEFPDENVIKATFEANLVKKKIVSSSIKKWNKNQTILLLWIIYHMIQLKNLNQEEELELFWDEIALFLGKTPNECVFKYYSLKKSQIQKREWNEEEDKTLSEIVSLHKAKKSELRWCQIAREFYQTVPFNVFRSDKACREHWITHLDPSVNRKPWTKFEDQILMNEFLVHGSKWTLISEKIKGKNVFSVKNRFFHLIKKLNLAKIHELLKKTIEIKKKQNGRFLISSFSSPQNNASQTIENQQQMTKNLNNRNFYQYQPNFNAFLVVPIILPNHYSEKQQNRSQISDNNDDLSVDMNFLKKKNSSEIISLNGEETNIIGNKTEKDSIDKYFSF